jgi:hypothetical protein
METAREALSSGLGYNHTDGGYMRAKFVSSLAMALLMPLATAQGLGRFFCYSSFSGHAASREIGQLVAGRGRGGPATNGLRVFIQAQRAPIPEDQPIAIVFHVTNVGAVNFDFGWCRNSWQPNFDVHVTTDRGKPVSKSTTQFGGTSGTSGRISRGEEHVEVGDLKDQYTLRPGKYYLTAIATLENGDGSGPLQAPSNAIKIAVIPASKDSPTGLRLSFGQAQWVFDTPAYVAEGLMLTGPGDHEIEIPSEKQGRDWFHDVTLDFRTLSGDPVPLMRGADGQELSLEKDGWGRHTFRYASSGPLRPGEYLDVQVLLSKVYKLRPRTAYTLIARLSLETSDGRVELVSNIVTFVIKAT